MLTRRQIRTKVLQAHYALQSSADTPGHVFNHLLDADWRNLRSAFARQDTEVPGEDDSQFLRDLFFGVVEHRAEYEKLILSKLENWELSRVALIDRILLLMGLHELLHLPTVPVKVSINEYLELAKEFSTDKSSQFVNGILDNLHQSLKAENKILKTGRGLLDPAPAKAAKHKAAKSQATPPASTATPTQSEPSDD